MLGDWCIDKLPKKDEGFEKANRELKASLDGGDGFKLARLVASFANHLGGTILVGATEKDGVVGKYVGVTLEEAMATKDAISKAVAARCSPKLSAIVDFKTFPSPDVPDKVVLAVCVEPYVGGQLVGVKVQEGELALKRDEGDTYAGASWVFPLRTISDGYYADPGELLMFTESRVRRAFLQLSQIEEGALITILHKMLIRRLDTSYSAISEMQPEHTEGRFHSLDRARNVVCITHPDEKIAAYPLDQVKTVYLPNDGIWVMEME